MSNGLRQISRKGGLPGRTFERTQGCWNCVHFENGRKSKEYWNNTAKPRDVQAAIKLVEAGHVEAAAEMRDTIKLAQKGIRLGVLGMCLAGKVKSEYVAHNYLCGDGWSGKQGASMARGGAAPDPTPEEMRELIDSETDMDVVDLPGQGQRLK